MFGKDSVSMRGHRVGVTGILWRQLKRREKMGQLVTVVADEYYTSQVRASMHGM